MKGLNLKPLFTAVEHSGYLIMLSIDSSVLLKASGNTEVKLEEE